MVSGTFVRLLTRAVLSDQRPAPNRDRQEADSDFGNLGLSSFDEPHDEDENDGSHQGGKNGTDQALRDDADPAKDMPTDHRAQNADDKVPY